MARKPGEKNHGPTIKYTVLSETVPYQNGADVKLSGGRKQLLEELNLYCEPFSEPEHAEFLAKRLTRLGISFKILLQKGTMYEGKFHISKVVPFSRYLVIVPYSHDVVDSGSKDYHIMLANRRRMAALRANRKLARTSMEQRYV